MMDEPKAYMIYCNPGEEFDYLVFLDLDQATLELEKRIDDGDDPKIIPLYSAE